MPVLPRDENQFLGEALQGVAGLRRREDQALDHVPTGPRVQGIGCHSEKKHNMVFRTYTRLIKLYTQAVCVLFFVGKLLAEPT